MKMTDNERKSITSILTAALHNARIVQDQLESLVNPDDKSFPDFPMDDAVKQVKEAVDAIDKALKGL